MVMTLQLTRMVVMMANPNMGWVKTVRAILLIGWNGERIHIAFVAENLKMIYMTMMVNQQGRKSNNLFVYTLIQRSVLYLNTLFIDHMEGPLKGLAVNNVP